MASTAEKKTEGFDIVVNGSDQCFADLELSAIAAAGFHKEHYPNDTVQIRNRANAALRTVVGHSRLV